jgi:hypothetical protein
MAVFHSDGSSPFLQPMFIITSIAFMKFMCKLMERVILERLVAYIEGNRFIDPTQEGIRKNHSTTNALLRLVQSIVDGFNKGECNRLQTCSCFL